MTLAILALLVALFALQAIVISYGARGTELTAYALFAFTTVVFLGPFLAGSIWFGRRMHPHS